MKFKHLLMTLLALWGAIGSASAEDLTISDGSSTTEESWLTFCSGSDTYAGKTVTLNKDITITSGFSREFAGTFDGQGHTITVNLGDASLFSTVTGTIQNLKVTGNISTNIKGIGGIASNLNRPGHILRCISDVTITSTVSGDGTLGGIVGRATGSTADSPNRSIENCAFYGTIDGGSNTNACAGIAGWAEKETAITNCVVVADINLSSAVGDVIARGESGNAAKKAKVSNCYYLVTGTYCPTDNICGGTPTTTAESKSGKLCYLLNGSTSTGTLAWHQTLGAANSKPDPLTTNTSTVYEVSHFHCDRTTDYGTKAYSNTTAAVTDAHSYDNTTGFCTYCNTINGSHAGEKYQIDNLKQFQNFVNYVNDNHGSANACLLNDITGNVTQGIYQDYTGTFDGQGHTITVNLTRNSPESGEKENLFFSITGNGVVKNLVVDGTITTSVKYAAGIATHLKNNAQLQNCISNVTINSSVSENGTHGGLVGQTSNTATNKVTIKDCAFYGTINGGGKTSDCAGIIGWAENKTSITNCVVIAEIIQSATSGDVIARGFLSDTRGHATVTNCYYQVSGTNCPTANIGGGTATTTADSESGKLCYSLNSKTDPTSDAWHQTLGSDDKPIPFATGGHGVVYVATTHNHCNGTAYTQEEPGYIAYSNTEGATVRDAHTFGGNGFCSREKCQAINEEHEGNYQISTLTQLQNFATFVNGGHTSANALLEADIVIPASPQWTPIGNADGKRYAGTFDGRQHKITMNITVASDADEHQDALFGRVEDATIHDLIVDGVITSGKKYAAGIASYIKNTTIERCVSFVTLNCTFPEPTEPQSDSDPTEDTQRDASYGGIAGYVDAGSTIKDCAFYGQINGTQAFRCSGIAGWLESGCAGQEASEACPENDCQDKEHHHPIHIKNCNVLMRLDIWKANDVTDQDVVNTHGIARYRNEATGEGSETRWIDYGVTIENCYYTSLRRAYRHDRDGCKETFLWGELWGEACYGLNESRKPSVSTPVWYQDLSKDWYPMPYYDADNSEKNARVYKSIKYKETPVAYSNSESGKKFTDGENTINNFSDFLMFANAVNAGKISETVDPRKIQVKLNTDITIDATSDDVRHKKWMEIGYRPNGGNNGFCGTIDGNGHTLTVNFPQKLQSEQLQFGIVSYVYEGATIKNLTVTGTLGNDAGNTSTDAHPFGYDFFGCKMNDVAIVGKLQTGALTFDNVTCNLNVKGNQNVGGFVGYMCSDANNAAVTIDKCTFSGNTKAATSQTAGFVGTVEGGTLSIKNSISAGTVTSSGGDAGGFVGQVNNKDQNGCAVTLLNCTNSSNITALNNVSGMIGNIAQDNCTYNLTNCLVSGTIKATETNTSNYGSVGGYLGWGTKVNVTAKSILFNGKLQTAKNDSEAKGHFEKVALFRCNSDNSVFTDCENLFYKEKEEGTYDKVIGGSTTNKDPLPSYVQLCSTDQLASGEVCWKLGSDPLRGGSTEVDKVWRQDLTSPSKDATPWINYVAGTANDDKKVVNDNVKLSSTFNYLNTLLPRSNAKVPTGYNAYKITSRNDEDYSLLNLEKVDKLEPYMPVFIKGTADITSALYGNTETPKGEVHKFKSELMVGVDQEYPLNDEDENCYVLAKNYSGKVAFFRVAGTKPTIAAYKAYVQLPVDASISALVFDEESTSIQVVTKPEDNNVNAIYNLSGQRINQMQRGVNIVNGKKVLK